DRRWPVEHGNGAETLPGAASLGFWFIHAFCLPDVSTGKGCGVGLFPSPHPSVQRTACARIRSPPLCAGNVAISRCYFTSRAVYLGPEGLSYSVRTTYK